MNMTEQNQRVLYRRPMSNKKVDYGIQNCINKYLTKWDKEFKDKLNG